MSDNKGIDLTEPVTVNGQTWRGLTMRAPKVRDMLVANQAGKSDAEREVVLFANLCGVTREVVEELTLPDYGALQVVYSGFLS